MVSAQRVLHGTIESRNAGIACLCIMQHGVFDLVLCVRLL